MARPRFTLRLDFSETEARDFVDWMDDLFFDHKDHGFKEMADYVRTQLPPLDGEEPNNE